MFNNQHLEDITVHRDLFLGKYNVQELFTIPRGSCNVRLEFTMGHEDSINSEIYDL